MQARQCVRRAGALVNRSIAASHVRSRESEPGLIELGGPAPPRLEPNDTLSHRPPVVSVGNPAFLKKYLRIPLDVHLIILLFFAT